MNSTKAIRLIYYFIGVLLIAAAVLVFQFVAKPLFPEDVTEVDKRLYFDYSVNRAMEYDELGNAFWWLEMGENSISLMNVGDETIVGTVTFTLGTNPCNFYRGLELSYLDQTDKVFFSRNQEKYIHDVNIRLEPFQSEVLSIASISGLDCNVKNGDERNFLLRLRDVRFS